MKYIFDEGILTIKSAEDKIILYNPHTHYSIRVSDKIKPLIDDLKRIGSDKDFCLEDLDCKLSSDDIQTLFLILEKYKFIFKEKNDFDNNSYYKKVDAANSRISIKIAYLHVTQRCNLNCEYCYNKNNLNKLHDLKTEEWKKIILQLKNIGTEQIIFTGGEPLLRDDISLLVQFSKELGLHVQLLTNGTLLNDEKCKVLKYVDQVVVSLDDIDIEINKKNRKGKLSGLVLNNLQIIADEKEYDSKKIVVRSVVTKDNVENISSNKQYVKEKLGMEYITTLRLPNTIDELEYVPDYKEEISEEDMCKLKYDNKIVMCGGCYKEIAINCTGDLYPCQSLIKEEFLIGNILEDDWYEKLKKSKVTRQFMECDVRSIEKCNKCSYRFLCGGGCRAISYNLYGNMNKCIDFICDFSKRNAEQKLLSMSFKKEVEDEQV